MARSCMWIALAIAVAASLCPAPCRAGEPVVGIIETVAGGAVDNMALKHPQAVAIGPDGSLYIGDTHNSRVVKVDAAGAVSVIARVGVPYGIAAAADGSVYVSQGTDRVSKIDPAGVVQTVVGGQHDPGEEGTPASRTVISNAWGLALGADGSLFVAGGGGVRRIDPSGGVTVVAGGGAQECTGQEGIPANWFRLCEPHGVALGPDGSVYVAEYLNGRVRRIDREGIMLTVAGGGQPVFGIGDRGPAKRASVPSPYGVAVGPDGSVYISQYYSARIRRVDSNGIITTVAGNGKQGSAGDCGLATEANLDHPAGLAVAPDGTLYVADSDNDRIRRIRWVAGKAAAEALRAKAGGSADAWRQVAEVYLTAECWEEAVAAADRWLALLTEAEETARIGAHLLAAEALLAKGDKAEALRRCEAAIAIPSRQRAVCEAVDAVADLYLRRGGRDQAIAALKDLRERTQERFALYCLEFRIISTERH